MSFNNLSRFKNPKNPYLEEQTKKEQVKENVKEEKSILQDRDKHLFSLIYQQKREIERLKEDLISLFIMFKTATGDENVEVTNRFDSLEIYNEFSTNENHVLMQYQKNKQENNEFGEGVL